MNECVSSPCLNEGVCVDQINRFSCSCASGFTGQNRCLSGGVKLQPWGDGEGGAVLRGVDITLLLLERRGMSQGCRSRVTSPAPPQEQSTRDR